MSSKNALWHSSDRSVANFHCLFSDLQRLILFCSSLISAATWEEQNMKRDSLFLMCVYMKNTTEGVGVGIGLTDFGEGMSLQKQSFFTRSSSTCLLLLFSFHKSIIRCRKCLHE